MTRKDTDSFYSGVDIVTAAFNNADVLNSATTVINFSSNSFAWQAP